MKKLTLLTFLCALLTIPLGYGQSTSSNYVSLTEANAAGERINSTTSNRQQAEITEVISNAVTSTYNDRGSFQAAAPGLIFEDFAGGPAACVQGCDDFMDSSGGICYPPGELQPGFVITAAPGTMTPYIYCFCSTMWWFWE